MSFKPKESIVNDAIPVKESNLVQTFNCKDFKGKLSSITGIQSKFLYIAKLRNHFDEVISESPTVKIICGIECKDKCINLGK